MRKCFSCIVFMMMICSFGQRAAEAEPEMGVSRALAQQRKAQISQVGYELSFEIPKLRQQDIVSDLTLNLYVSHLKQPLILDFKEKHQNIKALSINGKSLPIQLVNGHILISAQELRLGFNRLYLSFIAGNLSLNRNDDFLYSLLVPDRASTFFPCLDQPDLKATYKLRLRVPREWRVLSAAPIEQTVEAGEFVVYDFEKSNTISTYLFSIVAGNFKELSQGEMRMLYRENDSSKIRNSSATLFKLHRQSLDFLGKYTNYRFPFKKLDFAAIPIFQYGGMEHMGAVLYKEATLFLDSTATDSDRLDRAKLIAHESSHMWFGNLVTMKWFDDVWMKEVFANFMADKIMNPLYPKLNHNLQFLTAHYPSAYAEDRSLGTHPIKQPLDNLKDAGSLYGNIIYNKAPVMMRQLEALIGQQAFEKGVRKYIRKYAFQNADWNDLIQILDAQTALDLRSWSEVWVNQSSRPLFEDHISYDNNHKIKTFELRQQAEDQTVKLWPQLFTVGLLYENGIKILEVNANAQKVSLKSAIGLEKPLSIFYNYNGFGYGVFPLGENVLESVTDLKDEVARMACYINIYENTLIGNIKPLNSLACFAKALEREENELVLKVVGNQLQALFWRYLSPKIQSELQSELADKLYQRLSNEAPNNIKKTLFALFRDLAYSKRDRDRLYQIWNKETQLDKLELNEDDQTNIAMNLAIFDHEKAQEILAKARTRITNPDKQRRFEFLLPSLSQNLQERTAFMESLKEAKNREKESWVITALSNFHHPLRQEQAKEYIGFCLAIVEEIQQSGGIFFPKDWLANSIGKYNSADAFEKLQLFLKERPNFNPILKRKLLQATDALYRAQRIKSEIP